ncbi:cobalt/nickel transport system permease protein [Anaerosolibacter carboniphilus]|uniref:Cobalt/nickel transport system permease protein n=1 Tax=Anaerosolibacter carboniphilus TaxID=1417629 RepID=A0A841KP38_9FIRM|nr:cobalt ECF transporter T component CbiQ [Anaerosolibacter carboniphilus]MBB6215173.1 cobalt/nickel transport system permease protein [Anaerosolibacter carboniphilus]
MANITESLNNIRILDELAEKKTVIHNIHPLMKVLVTIVYLIVIVSFDKYQISGLLSFILYPIVLMALGEIPYGLILKRTLIGLPFIIGVGMFNPLFDRDILVVLPWAQISGGWISFLSLLIKGGLTIIAALILIGTTGMPRIAEAFQIMRVPRIFIMQLLFTYRYIFVLAEEVGRTVRGYSLRSPNEKGIQFIHWGPLTGQLLLRTLERAQRIYQAMYCRGFTGEFVGGSQKKVGLKDILYFIGWSAYFIMVKYTNISTQIGRFVTGVVK